MEFIMLLGNQGIDSIQINPIMLLSPVFLYDLQKELTKRNEYMLSLLNETPQFAIDNVPSKMILLEKVKSIN